MRLPQIPAWKANTLSRSSIRVVNALTSAGIMVILDNHMSNAGWCCSTTDNNELWYNSSYPEANWIADWQTWRSATRAIPG